LQGPNPLAALSALVASVAVPAGAESAQDAVSLPKLVEALTEQVAQLTENGQPFDLAMLQDIAPQAAGFAQADLVQDPLAGEGFGEHADHEADHGRAAVDQFHPLELLLMDLGGSGGLIPRELAGLAAAGGVSGIAAGHGWDDVARQL
jgi:hypothetical protein